jgi:two-component system cell cycle sensor histidine kinase/response regulator CckA
MIALRVMPVSLVVDDEPSVRRYMSTILQREDFRTLEAQDGAHALQIVQELGGGVDLIVSDIQMPNGDGLSFAQAIKATFPAVPVILVSGNARPDADFEFVKKPFLPATLLSVVRKFFPCKLYRTKRQKGDVDADPAVALEDDHVLSSTEVQSR